MSLWRDIAAGFSLKRTSPLLERDATEWRGGDRRRLVVAATGLWVAFVYFFPPPKFPEVKASQPGPANVEADCSGIAIGGNVTGATIRTGAMTNSDCASKPK